MTLDLEKHPCFNDKVRATHGRIHLPVAPRCNVQCRFCNRDFDCANESRPGVTSVILEPEQALMYLGKALEKDPRISVVGIAGPGDPFANADQTMETLRLVRKHYPEILLCVATNGLAVGPYIDELAELNVGHVTITINAIDPNISEKVYAWMRVDKRVRRGEEAASLLIERQLDAVRRLVECGITVKINTILIPGINDEHVETVASTVAELGASIFNVIPLYPVDGTEFAQIEPPSAERTKELRDMAEKYLPQMKHCGRCRADAVGLIGELMPEVMQKAINEAAGTTFQVIEEEELEDEMRPYVAVATSEGILVNQHLGEAEMISIYQRSGEDEFQHVEDRRMPPKGGGDQRWQTLADRLKDCRAVIVSGIGPKPAGILRARGIRVAVMEGLIAEGLDGIYNDRTIRAPSRCGTTCGSGCAGSGTGCG